LSGRADGPGKVGGMIDWKGRRVAHDAAWAARTASRSGPVVLATRRWQVWMELSVACARCGRDLAVTCIEDGGMRVGENKMHCGACFCVFTFSVPA
jgi:hypothetical protein